MGSVSRYWRLVRIAASGDRKVEELTNAKAFFQQRFTRWVESMDVADLEVQQALLLLMQTKDNSNPNYRELAGLCLRCYISHEIEQECIRLEQKFGDRHGFTRRDLFPFVLNDEGRQPLFQSPDSTYRPLAFQVLQTFDPKQAKLNTWVTRLVKSCRTLNAFLRECGVYLESDWSILNQTRREQLQRILTEFHALSSVEVEQACQLLQAYHQVYRQDRLMQRQQGLVKGKEKCMPPTPDQLTRMVQLLDAPILANRSSSYLLSKLQTIALQIRQFRLAAPPMQSLNQTETPLDVAAPQRDEAEAEQQEFLQVYREQLLICLDEALEQATSDRVGYLQRKKPQNVELYMNALHLFHCQGYSMGEIARQLGMRAQDAVTRLLELKNFRAAVQQKLLILLCDRLLDRAKIYAAPSCLQQLNQRLEVALDEQIAAVIQAAEIEATVARNCPLESLFARRLCHYLDTRRSTS